MEKKFHAADGLETCENFHKCRPLAGTYCKIASGIDVAAYESALETLGLGKIGAAYEGHFCHEKSSICGRFPIFDRHRLPLA